MLEKLLTFWNPPQYSVLVYEDLHRLIQSIVLDSTSLTPFHCLSIKKTKQIELYIYAPQEVCRQV